MYDFLFVIIELFSLALSVEMLQAEICRHERFLGTPLPAPSQIFGPCLLWSNGWTDEAGTWHGGRPQPRRLCVRWGPSPLPEKGAELPPQFSAHFYCGQTAACIKIPHGMELSLGPGDFVLDGDPVALSPKRGRTPKFSAHIYCDQTSGWRKLVLGMVVGLSRGEFVLDGDPAHLAQKGQSPLPNFKG